MGLKKARHAHLSGHNQAASRRVDCHVSSNQTHVFELLVKFSVFLITQSLDWSCINDSLVVLQRLSNAVPVCDNLEL